MIKIMMLGIIWFFGGFASAWLNHINVNSGFIYTLQFAIGYITCLTLYWREITYGKEKK